MPTNDELMPGFSALRTTKFTKTVHDDVYPAISPSRPELSQAGRTILVPGGGTGVGFAIASAFVRASAARIILISRRAEVLSSAASKLSVEAAKAGTDTEIIAKACDVNDKEQVDALWEWFASKNIVVDVLIANVALFDPTKPLLEFGTEGVWSHFETNVKSQLLLAEKFNAQGEDRQKV
jgi:NAD(P)-dependent dehydrogenase (short-subunit alcohol dehydrogenase family)